MDKDLRVELPLWTIGALLLLMLLIYHGVNFIDLTLYNFEVFLLNSGTDLSINWTHPTLIWMGVSFGLMTLFYLVFLIRFRSHNRLHPEKKLYFFSFTQPGELLEDDEMLHEVTKRATKKVYILYSNTLPMLILLMFLPLHRFVYIFAVFSMLIAQYAMFYWDVRKYFKGSYRFQERSDGRKLNKYILRGLIMIGALILFLGVGRIVQIHVNSQSLLENFDECLDKGGTAVVEGGTFWSLSKFSCEK